MKKKIESEEVIPSIETLEELYREDKQKNAERKEIQKEEKEKKKTGSFFEKFRHFDPMKETVFSDELAKNCYYLEYKKFKEEELSRQQKIIEALESAIEYEKFFLRWEQKNTDRSGMHSVSNSATRYRSDRVTQLEKELEKTLQSSPEAWEFYYRRLFKQDIHLNQNNRLIPVPYVEQAKRKVISALEKGLPVYLVGHLGSGKTQLAMEAAVDFTIQNLIQKDLEIKMEDWFLKNGSSAEQNAIEIYGKFYREQKAYYEQMQTEGTDEELEKLRPLFISGSHNLTYEDMFIEKTLTLEQSFTQGSFSDYLNIIIQDFSVWMENHKEQLEEMPSEEQLHLKIQIWKTFSDLFVAKNSAYGTAVKKIEREILIAVKEGRPVIVDELNTIAMQNLIGLNDILQHHAGDQAYITGVGQVCIEPGFGFIGTGNLSTRYIQYEGTNDLNPAFKSRFQTIEYNYVNQSIAGLFHEQEGCVENELFRIILTELADKEGNLILPNLKQNVDELFRFAQLSKTTQNIFMGKWKDEDSENRHFANVELKESLLSIRNILHVLDSWNKGEEKDLSKALWDGFISSITEPADQSYILSQAVRFGFFLEEEGWHVKTKGESEASTVYEEIRSRPYVYERPAAELWNSLNIIELLFGKGLQRKKYPAGLFDSAIVSTNDGKPMGRIEYKEMDDTLRHFEHTLDILEYLETDGKEPKR